MTNYLACIFLSHTHQYTTKKRYAPHVWLVFFSYPHLLACSFSCIKRNKHLSSSIYLFGSPIYWLVPFAHQKEQATHSSYAHSISLPPSWLVPFLVSKGTSLTQLQGHGKQETAHYSTKCRNQGAEQIQADQHRIPSN